MCLRIFFHGTPSSLTVQTTSNFTGLSCLLVIQAQKHNALRESVTQEFSPLLPKWKVACSQAKLTWWMPECSASLQIRDRNCHEHSTWHQSHLCSGAKNSGQLSQHLLKPEWLKSKANKTEQMNRSTENPATAIVTQGAYPQSSRAGCNL